MGDFLRASVTACGVPHRFCGGRGRAIVLTASASLADTQKICETAIRFLATARQGAVHQLPVHAQRGERTATAGWEHRNSTALICGRRATFLATGRGAPERGLHHAARPHQPRTFPHLERREPAAPRRALSGYYVTTTRKTGTQLLWSFEVLPSYYDRTCRCAVRAWIDDATHVKLSITKTIKSRRCKRLGRLGADRWHVGPASMPGVKYSPPGRVHPQRHGELLKRPKACWRRCVFDLHLRQHGQGHAGRRGCAGCRSRCVRQAR